MRASSSDEGEDGGGAKQRKPRQRSTSVEGSVGVEQLREAVQHSPEADFQELTGVVNEELHEREKTE
jgi:hypothetical protein